MRKINIITDTTSDLTPELLKKNDIRVMPLFVGFGEESYRDGIDITTEELYKKVEQFKALPKTAAIPPAIFHELFSSYSPDEDVIYMGIGLKFSATGQNAMIVANEFDNVYIIDSQNLSSGTGLLLLKMCQYRDQGLAVDEIIKKVESLRPLIKTQFAINTLDYLHLGGRCSGTSKIFGTLLKIKPIIRVVNGEMVVAKKPRGKFTKALDTLLDYVKADVDNLDLDFMMVTHSLAGSDASYLLKELKSFVKVENIYETKASGVISTHCGPRTIGILYIVKR